MYIYIYIYIYIQAREYGKLLPHHTKIASWNEFCIILIGPLEIVVDDCICVFKALTCINPVTNLVEVIITIK